MKSLWLVCHCAILVVSYCEITKCDDPRETIKALSNYPTEKAIVLSLNQTVVVVLESSKKDKSLVYTVRYPHHKEYIDDITQYFKGHVNDVIVQPQKLLGIFTETDMKHIVVLHDDSTMLPKVYELDFLPSTLSFPDNNNDGKFFIIFDNVERKIHFTQSGGRKFQLLIDNVESFEWQYDDGKNYLLVERRASTQDPSSSLEYIELTPIFNKKIKFVTLADQVRDFSVNGHFILIHRANDTLLYYKRQEFVRTLFYPVYRVHNIHIVDTENNSIKIIAENDQESRFYVGNYYTNSRTIRFELSLTNIERDYLTKINSADGVYIATQNNASKSVITYDNGRTWNVIELNIANNKIFSSKLIPGVIAVPIGRHFMISQDGGKTWIRNADLNYGYKFNNILGIIIGINLDKSRTRKTLKYSTTYGLPWTTMNIYEKPLKNHVVYSKDESMDFYIVADDEEHNNYLIRIDFSAMFKKPCEPLDFGMFTTDVCVLGQKVTYQRRNSSCFPGENVIKNIEVCDCNFSDYDCGSNFARINLSQACKQIPGIAGTAPVKCGAGEVFYNKATGYQKIESSVCKENYKSVYAAEMTACPYTNVDFLLAKMGNTLKLYDENNHQMKSMTYFDYDSRVSYEFDLLNKWMLATNHTVVNRHSINKNAQGIPLIRETVTIRNLNYDWISGWVFYIVKPPLMIKAFPVQPTNRTHSKIIAHSDALTRITGLTVHVVHKYVYWRDGNGFKQAILKYNHDNTDITKISEPVTVLHGQSIGSDLVIDYVADRLYFYNTQEGFIMNCNLFGVHCGHSLKAHWSDHPDPNPTNVYLTAISHAYIYFYNPHQKTVEYWDRSKEFTDSNAEGQILLEHDLHDVTEMKCVSKSIQLYTKCLMQHPNSAMCLNVLNLNKSPKFIAKNPIVTEAVCPNSKYCDGVFDCIFGEDEEYCMKGAEEVVIKINHKMYWIGIVLAFGVISFMVASLVLYKRIRPKVTGVRYSVVENRVLINEDILEDDESDIEMLFN